MNVLTLLGSPRKKGNTATVLSWVEEELSRHGHPVEHVSIADHEIRGCLGCMACQKDLSNPGCAQKDDAQDILEKILEADRILYATPLYCWGFTSQMKALIDRQFCLVKHYGTENQKSLAQGKKTALLVTCAGPVEQNADLIQVMFDRINRFAGAKVLGKQVIPRCVTPDDLGEEAREKARQTADMIIRG